MTKGKIFIAGALLVVATCGAFATKAVNKLVTITVWTVDAADNKCKTTTTAVLPCTTDVKNFDCKIDFGAGLTTVYQTSDPADVSKCKDKYFTDIQP